MILRPGETPTQSGGGYLPAWAVIEHAQRRAGSDCWIITQPDHAKLSGELAAAISAERYPRLEADVVAGIALHDAGWADFDTPDAPAVSFLDADPRQIGAAWTGSVEAAARASAVAGYLVSRHFARIAQSDLGANKPEAAPLLAAFVAREEQRQAALLEQQRFTREELEGFTDVLQFCDLLSLYLCCGAGDNIEFPQRFSGRAVRLHNTPDALVLEPSPFASPQMFWVRGRRAGGAEESVFAFALR
jgi:hypothetical protein